MKNKNRLPMVFAACVAVGVLAGVSLYAYHSVQETDTTKVSIPASEAIRLPTCTTTTTTAEPWPLEDYLAEREQQAAEIREAEKEWVVHMTVPGYGNGGAAR